MEVKSIKPCGVADVYNMEVEDTHDFVVQDGVVVHNCYDETRYFFMARPMNPVKPIEKKHKEYNPLDTDNDTRYDKYEFYRTY